MNHNSKAVEAVETIVDQMCAQVVDAFLRGDDRAAEVMFRRLQMLWGALYAEW